MSPVCLKKKRNNANKRLTVLGLDLIDGETQRIPVQAYGSAVRLADMEGDVGRFVHGRHRFLCVVLYGFQNNDDGKM